MKLDQLEVSEENIGLADATCDDEFAGPGVDEEEFSKLVLEHRDVGQKLARSMLRKWQVRMTPEEVDSAVDLALCQAAKRFSGDMGASFSTFLFHYVRGNLVRMVDRAVTNNKINRAAIYSIRAQANEPIEVNESDTEFSLQDPETFGPKDTESPEEAMLRDERLKIFREVYEKLDDFHKEVLTASYIRGQTPNKIAKDLGCPRSKVVFSKRQALKQLKALALQAGIAPASYKEEENPLDNIRRPATLSRRRFASRIKRRAIKKSEAPSNSAGRVNSASHAA